jgi:hypothetical protein
MSCSYWQAKSHVIFRAKKRRRKRPRYFSIRNIERETVAEKDERFSRQKNCVTCIAPKNGLPSALQAGMKKANPREAHNQDRTKNCTTIVVLPSPRSLFSSIERRLDCRFPSAARQRNQSRLKQTITTPIQDESIRQDGANVNSLSTCTRPGTELTEGFLQIPSTSALRSLIELLSVSCRSLVDLL